MEKEYIKKTEEETEKLNTAAGDDNTVDDASDEAADAETAEDENPDEDISDEDSADAEADEDIDDPEDETAKEKSGSVKSSDAKLSDADTLASNRKKIIIEIALAVIAVIALVVAIVLKQKQESASDSNQTPDIQASSTESNEMIAIDNSALYNNPPAVSAMVQNETLDYEALVSEGKMLKLTGENGEEIYVHNYTNSTYFNEETVLDESAVDERIKKDILSDHLEPVAAGSRDTAEMYDTVSINFAGTMDGVAFDGGTADDQELTIGISAYIDGFTEGIVGMKVGETKDVHVTFPEDYSNTELAGKPAVFAITLNQIITGNTVPELTDSIASTYTGGQIATAKELRDYYKKNMLATSIWDFIDTDFHVSSLSEEKILSYYNQLIETLDKSSQQYQMSAESLIGMYYGMEIEEYKAQMMADAVESMRHATLYNAIAAKEGITVSDDDILKLATDYGYADNVEGFKEEYGMDIIHDYILQSNLMDYFITLHK